MTNYFSINNFAFYAFGNGVSWLEVWGTLFGIVAVVLTAFEKISSWPIGILNVILLFFLFYQSNLYADMFLQIFFFVTNLLGWWQWSNPKEGFGNQNNQLIVSYLDNSNRLYVVILSIIGTLVLGYVTSHLHLWLPSLFPSPAAYAYSDTFVMSCSIIAQILMTHKKIENWILWIVVDIVAALIYFYKSLFLLSIEYALFCVIAAYGFYSWKRAMK